MGGFFNYLFVFTISVTFCDRCRVLAQEVQHHQVWIQAAGIDPFWKSNNDERIYDEAIDFNDACRRAGLNIGTDCQSYIDLTVPTNFEVASLKSESVGKATTSKVIDAFESALDKAKPGDQTVLNLVDHGFNGFMHSSCIYMSPMNSICANDIQAALKLKKPGVKVLVVAEACDSGAFTELSSKEVCTYTSSDKFQVASNVDFWSRINAARENTNGPVSLEYLRKNADLFSVKSDGGGFASNLIKRNFCKKSESKLENKRVAEFLMQLPALKYEIPHLQTRIGESCMNQDFRSFSSTMLPLIQSMDEILDPSRKVLPELKNQYCHDRVKDPDAAKVCETIQSIDKNFADLTDLQNAIKDKLLVYQKQQERLYELDSNLNFLKQYGDLARELTPTDKSEASSVARRKTPEQESATEKSKTRSSNTTRKIADVEASRGKLLDDLLLRRSELADSLKSIQKNVAFDRIIKDLENLTDDAYVDFGMIKEDFHVSPYLTLTALTGNRIPKGDKAFDEARECEKSFIIP